MEVARPRAAGERVGDEPAAGAEVSAAEPRVGAAIRERRRRLRLTLSDVCAAAGISVGYLSLVERDLATPSLGTLAQIARCLGVGVDYFIAAPSAGDSLTRAGARERFSVEGSSIRYERLAADFAGNTLSSFIMHVPPGYRSETVAHEGEEILYVLDGVIVQRLDDEEIVMRPGDSVHFRGTRPHSWRNETAETARILWTGTLPLFRAAADTPPAPAKPSAKKPSQRKTTSD